MSHKEVGQCALDDYNPDGIVDLEFSPQAVEFLRQNFVKKIYRRVIDANGCDA
jgi:hypothetical protein